VTDQHRDRLGSLPVVGAGEGGPPRTGERPTPAAVYRMKFRLMFVLWPNTGLTPSTEGNSASTNAVLQCWPKLENSGSITQSKLDQRLRNSLVGAMGTASMTIPGTSPFAVQIFYYQSNHDYCRVTS